MIKTIAATQLGMLACTKQHTTPATAELLIEGKLPSLAGAIAWLNSQPLTVNAIKGGIGHNLPQEAPREFANAVVEVDSY